jgi:hypothetical protein
MFEYLDSIMTMCVYFMKKFWLWFLDVKFLGVHAHETLYIFLLIK